MAKRYNLGRGMSFGMPDLLDVEDRDKLVADAAWNNPVVRTLLAAYDAAEERLRVAEVVAYKAGLLAQDAHAVIDRAKAGRVVTGAEIANLIDVYVKSTSGPFLRELLDAFSVPDDRRDAASMGARVQAPQETLAKLAAAMKVTDKGGVDAYVRDDGRRRPPDGLGIPESTADRRQP